MTLQELDIFDLSGKQILIIGKAASGKTHIAKCLALKYGQELIHTDDYLIYDEVGRQVYAAFEDAAHYKKTIIEGMLGYEILLEGFKRQTYFPDIVIECHVSSKKQREIYLKERDAKKLRHLRRFELANLQKLNEYFKICPKERQAQFISLENDY